MKQLQAIIGAGTMIMVGIGADDDIIFLLQFLHFYL